MSGPRYVADAADSTLRVELDGLTALFHRPSGMTHLLAPPAPQILQVLANNPGDPSEIVSRLSQTFEVEGEEAILARLVELEASGLVWRADPGNANAEPRDRAA
ncbi:HPr-rel-A system PqqD family peptide chaperone [Sphingosinicella humi]|uniref:HPr-rel-A system PqqD family peptide chaperone n=1 Tax=Allosphingosinicella humi TaxID=2068657 RepID=A0A2U2IZ75_9SPHN|nr:HPr-rel-A system PqqD family peptide chaperone [Sphingosinicella humi]PWG01382.1 HPr-rel-A system PqqD family peptide chaperone [Sphingosinicella humi]